MGIYATASGKKQGVAVSQELHGGGTVSGGLINIQTVRASEERQNEKTTVMKHFEE